MLSTSLIFILFSAIGMVLVVGFKISEIKTGKSGALARASITADPHLRRKIDAGKKVFRHVNTTNIRKILGFAVEKLFHIFGTAGLFVSKHHARSMRWIKGRKYIKGGGVVSFFLKNVAESKEEKRDQNHES
ncbi:MAG: hypothetical protein Q7S86_02820 [bacterium]|nr:hypothetical protein [bacterium]